MQIKEPEKFRQNIISKFTEIIKPAKKYGR